MPEPVDINLLSDEDVTIMIDCSEEEIAEHGDSLGPRTTLAVGRAYFAQRVDIAFLEDLVEQMNSKAAEREAQLTWRRLQVEAVERVCAALERTGSDGAKAGMTMIRAALETPNPPITLIVREQVKP